MADIVVRSDKNGGKVHLSADRVYDLNENQTQDIINTKTRVYLKSTGDATDRSAEILSMLTNYGVCYLTEGIYYISSGVTMPKKTSLFGMGEATIIQLADNASSSYTISLGSYCTVSNVTIKGNGTELPYSSYTKGSRVGILVTGTAIDFDHPGATNNFTQVSNVFISDFNSSGIKLMNTDGAGSALIENVDIFRCHTGLDISRFSEYGAFSNIRCRFCNIGLVMQGGNNLFTNCHIDANLMNVLMDGTNNQLPNDSHSSFSNCSFCHPDNNTGYNLKLLNQDNGLTFASCNFWYGKIHIEDSKSVMITGCIIGGSNNDIYIKDSLGIIFTSNSFKNNPTYETVGTNRIIWENNVDTYGYNIIKLSNGFSGNLYSIVKYTGSEELEMENFGVCVSTNKWDIDLPLPFSRVGTSAFNINRIVFLGKGSVTDFSNIGVTIGKNFIRVSSIPYTGTVGNVAMINVRGVFSFN